MISWRELNQRKGVSKRHKARGVKKGEKSKAAKTLTRLGDRLAKRRRREVRNEKKRAAVSA